MKTKSKIPNKYLKGLSNNNKKKKVNLIRRGQYLLRKKTKSSKKKAIELSKKRPLSKKKKKSSWTVLFREKYGDVKVPSQELARLSGMPYGAQKAIIRKGEGAFLSSGSRASVSSATQWGYARLYAVLMGSEKARKADKHILEKYNVKL